MDVGGWLRRLGLEQYEAAFRENRIDDTVLPSLTAEDLKDIGVGFVGDRRKLLDAIAAVRAEASAPTPLSDASPATDEAGKDTAERRQVTVMFSDLVGSTALSTRMDPEDLREVIAAYQRCVAETVRRFGGFVARYLGDGVLIYFGYPAVHEDDAERAIRSGLALIDAVATLPAPEPLQVRIGVATGTVVVGDLRDVSATRNHAEAAIALAAEHHMPMWRAYGTILRGWANAQDGCGEDGLLLVRQGIEELAALGAVFHRSHQLGILAEIHAQRGDPATGLSVIQQAHDEVQRTEVLLCQGELYRIEAELHSCAGAPDPKVEACLAEALAIARAQQAKSWELRAAMSMARLWRDQEKRDEARELLAPVYGWFTEGFDTLDLKQAKALLDELT